MAKPAPAAFISGTAAHRPRAWFTEERIAELTQRFGARPRLTWYDTHVTVDNLKDETRVNGKAIEAVA
jgi:hypothetical protein